jgi:gluconate 2-dehydrogenase gamma chain
MSKEFSPDSRRTFLRSTFVSVSTLTAARVPTQAAGHETSKPKTWRFLTEAEASFLAAAVERLIPADEEWPGAKELGAVNYIDIQMAGPWGRGEMIFRGGPFQAGTPSQGYQLEYTPAELMRRAIDAINAFFTKQGTCFAHLSGPKKDAYLSKLEKGGIDLNGVPSGIFFAFLWQYTLEGFFADPIYGGNKDKIAWKMIGFPGAYTDFYDLVDQHGMNFQREPMGIGDSQGMDLMGSR